MTRSFGALLVGLTMVLLARAADPVTTPMQRTAREALQSFNPLVGSWRATGTPEGTTADKQRGLWQEKLSWEWRFQDHECWLHVAFTNGKHFSTGRLHYLPDQDQFQLVVQTVGQESLTFVGPFKEKRLILERQDESLRETQRLVLTLLHDNRYVYQYEVKPAGRTLFTRVYQVGCTREGAPFAVRHDGPECIVSGGAPTIAVTYQGQTYYVCCSGCREAFKDNPEKYLKEYQQRQAKEKQAAKQPKQP